MREGNSTISGQNRKMVPVPNRGGTGTHDKEPKWYRYQNGVVLVSMIQKQNGTDTNQSGTCTNAVPAYRTGLVLVPIKVVPVLMQYHSLERG